MLVEAAEYLGDAPDDIRALTDHVITRIERLLKYENCNGAELTEALKSAQDLLTPPEAGIET